MQESSHYRAELHSFALEFASRGVRQLWRDDSLAKAEKMLFVGFFFVRKLIECQKVSDHCARSSTTISRGAIRRSREVSAFMRDDLVDDVTKVEWIEGKVDVHQLADKVIHAWWIVPFGNETSGLGGFVFTTDKQRNTELWLLPVSSIVEVFERFANSAVRSISAKRTETGRLTYWRAE
jgi:hypothetical protein